MRPSKVNLLAPVAEEHTAINVPAKKDGSSRLATNKN
jgi:hypothetical protein